MLTNANDEKNATDSNTDLAKKFFKWMSNKVMQILSHIFGTSGTTFRTHFALFVFILSEARYLFNSMYHYLQSCNCITRLFAFLFYIITIILRLSCYVCHLQVLHKSSNNFPIFERE